MNDIIYVYNSIGDYVENQKISMHTVFEEFITEEAPATRAYSTIVRYKSVYNNYLKDVFGTIYLYKISVNAIERFLNIKRTDYSDDVKRIYKLLSVLFRYAHKKKYMKKTP